MVLYIPEEVNGERPDTTTKHIVTLVPVKLFVLRFRKKRLSDSQCHGRTSLCILPYDVLLELFLYLGLQELKALRLTCRAVYRASEARRVWKHALNELREGCRDLVIDPLANLTTLDKLSMKRLVLRTDYLERNWSGTLLSKKSGRTRGREKSFRLAANILDPTPYSSALVTSRYIFLPKSDRILCLDIHDNALVASHPIALEKARTAFDHNASLGTMYAAVTGIANAQDLQLQIMEVSLPKKTAAKEGSSIFNSVSAYNLPNTWVVISKIMDPVSKNICLLVVPLPQPQALRLFYIFGWDAEQSSCCLVDTQIEFAFRLAQSSTSLRFTRDYSSVVLCAERDGQWIQKVYSVDKIRSLATPMPFTNKPENAVHAEPDCHSVRFSMPLDSSITDVCLRLLWAWPATWGFYTGPQIEFSDIAVYSLRLESGDVRWRIAQHYTSPTTPFVEGRAIIDLDDPPLVYCAIGDKKVPIVSVSFNHVAWIDYVNKKKLRRRDVKKRVMKLAAFPDPLKPGSKYTVVTLPDIPSTVLDRAYRVFLEPCTARIMIATTDNEMFMYQYA